MTGGTPIVLGHLGNTLDAFARCRAAGVDGVELDVRRAADNTLAVHHDAVIEGVGPIVGLRRADLPTHVPTLEQVLHECAGLVVNIEIKNLPVDPDYDPTEEIVGLVLGAVDETGLRDVIISSFSLATLDAVRAADPSMPTAFLTLPTWDQRRAIAAAGAHGHNAVHPHRRSLDRDLVDAAHGAGLTVHPWAIDDVDTARDAAALGVEAVISDDPAAVVATLRGGDA